jgi:hypothetical protein
MVEMTKLCRLRNGEMTNLREMMRDSPDAVPLRTNLKQEKRQKSRNASPALTFCSELTDCRRPTL